MHVFTYGSLVFPDVWNAVTREGGRRENAVLRGYRNLRVKDATFPGILHTGDDAHLVDGLLYFDLTPGALNRLDRFEDVFYERQTVSVTLADSANALEAEAYVVPPANASVLTEEEWDADAFARDHLAEFLERCCGAE